MLLYIARHGEATFNAPSDRERPLTPYGITATTALIDRHEKEFLGIQRIWSSELTRAIETATIYSNKLNIDVTRHRFLAPEAQLELIIERLQWYAQEAKGAPLLMVSHQPLIGDLVSVLCFGNVYDPYPFITSEVALLECDIPAPGLCELKATFRPD